MRVSPDGTQLFVALSGSPIGGPNVDESKLPPADNYAKALFPTLDQQAKIKETITKQWDTVVGVDVQTK